MKVYIFRILVEEEETFTREIALSENNTLLDFHNELTESVNADQKQLASFFITNKQWEKQKEYTLVDMEIDDYTNERMIDAIPVYVMENAYIGDIVEEPKQRMLYEYNFMNPTTFFISLIGEDDVEDTEEYPKLVRAEGNIDIDVDSLFDDAFRSGMSSKDKDYESYRNLMDEDGYDIDDLKTLGFEDESDLYGEEFYGSDSYSDDDF
ncbi:MAG: hypothetical protein LBH92_01850 [Bacteroidales bacterium]|jgi:hypothetical protein|nr:hypothetical protein [Bacteroidales bacterium]